MKIVECPRDAMQGLDAFIPTEKKIRYLNELLKVGFDTIDFGSFVSPKAIPQMRDTAEVLGQIAFGDTQSKLLAIVANVRGAEEACRHPRIRYVGFPLSISETFQQRNTNKSIAEALNTVHEIHNLCTSTGHELVTYISMAFGNPYHDPYKVETVLKFADILATLGIRTISLADTVGMATPTEVATVFSTISKELPGIEVGAHLHSNARSAAEKIKAGLDAGCCRFDSALKGFGGCPMAEDRLVGNIATETLIAVLDERKIDTGLNRQALANALLLADQTFPA